MRYFILISFIFSALFTLSSEIMEIGVFRDNKVSQLQISYVNSSFDIYVDSVFLGRIYEGNTAYVSSSGTFISANFSGKKLTGKALEVRKTSAQDVCEIKPSAPAIKARKYEGDFKIDVDKGYLRTVNIVPLNLYLAGVIEAESGAYQTKEYYKVQAIISRTYALKNKTKHRFEGFMLTDLTNCQVYKGMCRFSDEIRKAVEETRGLVIVDSSLHLITAAFYSNSGGQTANPEDVWNKAVPYLKSTSDPFSVGGRSCDWKKEIPRWKWLDYLKDSYQYPIEDSAARYDALNFSQESRKAFFVHPSYGIPLRDIRKDWRLMSTYFSIREEGSNVVLTGKGFGHGVGLAQEGAMKMVKEGFSYDQIIHFYYSGIFIMDKDKVDFFNLDVAEF